MIRRGFLAGVPAVLALVGCWTRSIEIAGAGATFPAPRYARWRALYHRAHP